MWLEGHSPFEREPAEAPEWLIELMCEEEKEKNAKALLDDETIAKKLDMPIERVKELRMNNM